MTSLKPGDIACIVPLATGTIYDEIAGSLVEIKSEEMEIDFASGKTGPGYRIDPLFVEIDSKLYEVVAVASITLQKVKQCDWSIIEDTCGWNPTKETQ